MGMTTSIHAGRNADPTVEDDTVSERLKTEGDLKITLISLHGLIRGQDPELGATLTRADKSNTCWSSPASWRLMRNVREVELLTRQIIDPKVDDDYAQLRRTDRGKCHDCADTVWAKTISAQGIPLAVHRDVH